eukprot:TRINITY_DN2324_c0_g1_i1.p2 TRINITY_DN2324_c0_g1~~TRINITY_DN2324_c0_g1_i1.p2  ORF type:complete len:113 (-),score=16.94 TRINITY_DN2324_c0_g1_i1:713-1051(-)
MAAKIIAELIVMGSGILIRAAAQAYRDAMQNGGRARVTQEVSKAWGARVKAMTEQEARMILGVTEKSSWEQVVHKYKALYDKNETGGSFYIQSKVQRAYECLEAIQRGEGPS